MNMPEYLQISDETCLRLFLTLLHFLWQGAAVGLVVVVGEVVLQGRSPASRYALNFGALVCMPLCVIATFLFLDAEISTSYITNNPDSARLAAESRVVLPDHIDSKKKGNVSQRFHHDGSAAPRSRWTVSDHLKDWSSFVARPVALGYGLCVCFFMLRVGRSICGGCKLRSSVKQTDDLKTLRITGTYAKRMGLSFVPLVGYCERVTVPMVIGLVRPVVLLPLSLMGLEADHLAAIISHELAHIRRNDLLMNLAQRFIESFLFFHPATWYVSRRVSVERELCCDELVLTSGQSSLSYAQALLEMAELCLSNDGARVTTLAASGNSPSEFERRIQRLIHGQPQSHLRLGRPAFLMLLCVALALPGVLQAWADDIPQVSAESSDANEQGASTTGNRLAGESESAAAHKVEVFCVGTDGNPIGGAEVYLFQQYKGEDGQAQYESSGPVESDARGRAVFSPAIFSGPLGNFDRWVYARVPGKLVGVSRSTRWIGRGITNPNAQTTMVPSRSVEGTVSVPEGFDPRGVTVSVRVMHVATGDGDDEYQGFPRDQAFRGLDIALPDIFECRPKSDGTIRLDDVPVSGRLRLITSGKGLGEAQWGNDWKRRSFDMPIDIAVEEERKILGRVVSPSGNAVEGVDVFARISSSNVMYLSTFSATTDESGEFEIRGLPDVEFEVSVRDPRNRWVFRPRERIHGAKTGGQELQLKMETGVLVSGRVLDADGTPIKAAGIAAVSDSQGMPGLDHDKTDFAGRYSIRLPSGPARLYFSGLPKGFEYPRPQIINRLEITPAQEPIENLDFTLEKKTD